MNDNESSSHWIFADAEGVPQFAYEIAELTVAGNRLAARLALAGADGDECDRLIAEMYHRYEGAVHGVLLPAVQGLARLVNDLLPMADLLGPETRDNIREIAEAAE